MANSKISSDMIKPFNGDGDVVGWLQKVKLVAKLSKVGELHNFIPLYLEDSALAVYLGMKEEDRESAEKIEERLVEVYTDGPFIAYNKLTSFKWTGESVDTYANELRRLAGLAGFEGKALELVVKLSFVSGFPDSIGVELQQITGIKNMAMSTLIPRARILASCRSSMPSAGVAASKVKRGGGRITGGRNETEGAGFRGKCFRCDGPHMARNCPEKKPVTCYSCGEEGHMSYNCSKQGNE